MHIKIEKQKGAINIYMADITDINKRAAFHPFSAFHPSEVDKMSTRNFWELSGKK